jgi:tetratricopeptide (TPR) repeat protein
MAAHNPKLRLFLYGRFRLETASGDDRAPKSAKSQALLALLATNETGGRGRLWLQKRLWPKKEADKASTSLRQALSEIRRSLGDDREILEADRRSVNLDLSRIDVVPAAPGAEFLEGIQLMDGDHAIGDWLDHHRAVVAPQPAQQMFTDTYVQRAIPARPIVVFQTQSDKNSDLALIEDIFVDCVARSMRETLSADVRIEGVTVDPNAFRVEVQAYRGEGATVGIRSRVRHGSPDTLVWSGMTSTQLHGAPPVEDLQIVSLGNQLIDALAEAMTGQITDTKDIRDANLLTRLAIRRIFTLKPENLLEADNMLAMAEELGAGALSSAWRAQLRVIQHVELHDGRSENLPDEARKLAVLAMEREPMNSMVVAAVANTRLVLDKDVNVCMELARRSVRLNPANPLAWNSLATAKLYAGDIGEAHVLAVRAQKISSGSPFGHWWDFGRCLTAALTGRKAEALQLAEAAHALSPEFRPPLRYLTALYAADERYDDALRTAERLKKLEPDFTFERMAKDETYPISPLRWGGLLDSGKVIALSG